MSIKPPIFVDKNLLANQEAKRTDFVDITLSLASPEKIRSWSYGEVRVAETINYRSFKPEPGGLFCAKIFGPIKDFECLCGKFKRNKHKNVICEKCGVEVTKEKVRRERMGHINLVSPVAHILFFKSLPSRIGLMLDLTMRDIERILYFEAYVVLDPKRVGEIDRGKLLNMDDYDKLVAAHGQNAFKVGIGAEGLRDFLKGIDLDEEIRMMQEELKQEKKSDARRKKIQKRLRPMKKFRAANIRPEWMILEALPVLPPNLRPLVALDGGRFTSSDLNDLYRRVINRNNRLRKLMEINAPDIIINNEKRMLQEAVDSLLDNSRRSKPAVGANKRTLKSLADAVKGKTGRFRQNLLGKRVDFSARSVIVVGPNLKLHQCGIPKHMALTLFRPFVLNALVNEGYVSNIKQAKIKADEPDTETWDVLEKIIHQHPVLLNRAPTLHRLGIQAFEPVLIEGKAIQLHPLPCVAFNADFDGDQMAVHVPLSLEAQAEARVLMLSANNILAPANGEPVTLPTQDIVLGIYCATRERLDAKGTDIAKNKVMRFYSEDEVQTAFAAGAVELQSKIQVLLPRSRNMGLVLDEGEEDELVLVDTTVGRLFMLAFLPERMPFSSINRTLKKKNLGSLVSEIFHKCGLRDTVIFCDKLMRFGFDWSTRSGVSICMQDMTIPDAKAGIIAKAAQEMQETQAQFRGGLLTLDERYNKSVDLWDKASEQVSQVMMEQLSRQELMDPTSGKPILENGKPKTQESFNSLYMMADSGARGSQTQIKQLAGMRGLMTKPDGRIMETAITANFREGLTVMEYFLSTHGARKGLADTALKTANSGYLTRRLVDVAQDVVVRTDDCGSKNGITLRAVLMGGEVVVPLRDRVLGRFLAAPIMHPQTSEVLFAADTFITEDEAEVLSELGVDEAVVRSTITCDNIHGICVKCYGRDLGRGKVVRKGEAVGVVAAQSIGEPGTQLTMRTFHIGGAASSTAETLSVEAKTDGTLRVNARHVKNSAGQLVIISQSGGEMSVHDEDGRERERYRLQYGEVLYFASGSKVKAGDQISTRDALTRPIITEYAGTVQIEDMEEGFNAEREVDDMTGVESWTITEDRRVVASSSSRKRKKQIVVQVKLRDSKGQPVKVPGTETEVSIQLQPGTKLAVKENDKVGVGDVIATKSQEARKSRDITGGLPRVAELFEAREPKNSRELAKASGRIEFKDIQRNKQLINIVQEDTRDIKAKVDGLLSVVAFHKGHTIERFSDLIQHNILVEESDGVFLVRDQKAAGEEEDTRVTVRILDDDKKATPREIEKGIDALHLRPNEKVYATKALQDVVLEQGGTVKIQKHNELVKKGVIVAQKDGTYLINAGTSEKGSASKKSVAVTLTVVDADNNPILIEKKKTFSLQHNEKLYVTHKQKVEAGTPIAARYKQPIARGAKIATVFRTEEHSIARERTILVQDGMEVKKGDEIVEGDANPHEILATRGVEALTAHIVDEIQSVYRLQGVTINDKHIETIVHQMLRCVQVTDPGDSRYLADDQLLLSRVLEENESIKERGGKPIAYNRVLLGITKASLATDSFISAASFQETARVLTEACISGQRDTLRGLKENVIVGRLIPAGTGFVHYQKLNAQKSSEEAEEIMREELSGTSPSSPPPTGEPLKTTA